MTKGDSLLLLTKDSDSASVKTISFQFSDVPTVEDHKRRMPGEKPQKLPEK